MFGGKGGTTRVAFTKGLKVGENFDLVTAVDLTQPSQASKLLAYVQAHRPGVIVMAPPCTAFGPWAHINQWRHRAAWLNALAIGKPLAELTCALAQLQLRCGNHFIIENPMTSRIWQLPCFQRLLHDSRCVNVVVDQCMVQLTDPAGQPTKKPTVFLASHELLISRLRNCRCDGTHQHAQLEGSVLGVSRTKHAQVWPRRLCELIVAGICALKRQELRQYPVMDFRRGFLFIFAGTCSSSASSSSSRRSSNSLPWVSSARLQRRSAPLQDPRKLQVPRGCFRCMVLPRLLSQPTQSSPCSFPDSRRVPLGGGTNKIGCRQGKYCTEDAACPSSPR